MGELGSLILYLPSRMVVLHSAVSHRLLINIPFLGINFYIGGIQCGRIKLVFHCNH